MRKRSRITTVGTFALLFSLMLPVQASASGPDCTEDYEECIEEAKEMKNWFIRKMAAIECSAEWVGCLLKKLESE